MEIKKELKKKIDEILVQHDILKLIGGGAPSDEYRLEIPRIIKLINEAETVNDLAKNLEDLYVKALAPVDDLAEFSDYLNLAADLFKVKK